MAARWPARIILTWILAVALAAAELEAQFELALAERAGWLVH